MNDIYHVGSDAARSEGSRQVGNRHWALGEDAEAGVVAVPLYLADDGVLEVVHGLQVGCAHLVRIEETRFEEHPGAHLDLGLKLHPRTLR